MKPKIEDIKYDVEELNKIKREHNTKNRQWKMRSLIGGLCIKCQEVPSKKVSYYVGDAWLVEYYCPQCFDSRKEGRSKKVIDKLS